MKASSILRATILLMTLVLILSACSMLGTDIMDRINMFASSLNSDRSTINSNFDQGLTQLLPSMTTAWWAANFPASDATHLYSVALSDYADPSNVVATISGPPLFNGGTGQPVNAVFVMSKEGADWFIERLFLNGSSTPLIY